MNTTQIRCFLNLAKNLSFSETAGELYLSQQAVSKNIARLEQELGAELFKRNRHSVTLTEEGRQYCAFFTHYVSEYKKLKNEIDRGKSVEAVQLRCGYQIGLDFGPVPYETLKEVQEKNPGFSHTCERRSPIALQQMLSAGDLDLILIYQHFITPDPGILSKELIRFPVLLMVSADDPNAVPGASFSDFSFIPFIFDAEDDKPKKDDGNSEIRGRASDFARDMGINPSEILLVYNRETAFSAAEQGLGYILTSGFSHIVHSSLMKIYPTNGTEALTAVWRADADERLIADYVSALKKNLEEYAVQASILTVR